MTTPTATSRTPFAEELTILFRATGLTRKEISARLGVSEATLSLWLNDRVLPRPARLHKILQLARLSAPQAAVERFLELASRRTAELSPRFKGNVERVRRYLLLPQEDAALAALRQLPVTRQEAILTTLQQECAAEAPTGSNVRSKDGDAIRHGKGVMSADGDLVDRVAHVLIRHWRARATAETPAEIRRLAVGMVHHYERGAYTPRRLICKTKGLEFKIVPIVRILTEEWKEMFPQRHGLRPSGD